MRGWCPSGSEPICVSVASIPGSEPRCLCEQQQHLIELIRQRETEAALEFAQTQLAEQGEESRECLTEMERTLALLAFDNPEESPFGDLLNMMQRQKVSRPERWPHPPPSSFHPQGLSRPLATAASWSGPSQELSSLSPGFLLPLALPLCPLQFCGLCVSTPHGHSAQALPASGPHSAGTIVSLPTACLLG